MGMRAAACAVLGVMVLGCSAELDCSSVSCLAPEILVETEARFPAGSAAELCGMGSFCVTVPVGVATRESSGVPLRTHRVDRRWFREDLVRGTTKVRILGPQGDVIAEGVGSVVGVHQCCAGSEVRFPA